MHIYICIYIYIYIYIASSNRVVLETLTRISDEHLANAARIAGSISTFKRRTRVWCKRLSRTQAFWDLGNDRGFFGFGKRFSVRVCQREREREREREDGRGKGPGGGGGEGEGWTEGEDERAMRVRSPSTEAYEKRSMSKETFVCHKRPINRGIREAVQKKTTSHAKRSCRKERGDWHHRWDAMRPICMSKETYFYTSVITSSSSIDAKFTSGVLRHAVPKKLNW